MKTILFKPSNGLGDKLLDVLGASVFTQFQTDIELNVGFNEKVANFAFGKSFYDTQLFNFDMLSNVKINNESLEKFPTFTLHSPNPSVALSPMYVHSMLKNISFSDVIEMYKKCAQCIKPSDEIEKLIPEDMSNVYGVHLRHTDKIIEQDNHPHETCKREHDIIMKALFDDIRTIIKTETNPCFFVCSESLEWKKTVMEQIQAIGQVTFIELNENNNPVLDMFMLSRCKRIFQGIKYSTFSILASIIGQVPLTNYSHLLECYHFCLIQGWRPVLYNELNPFPVHLMWGKPFFETHVYMCPRENRT